MSKGRFLIAAYGFPLEKGKAGTVPRRKARYNLIIAILNAPEV